MKALELLKTLKDYFGTSQVILQTQLDEAIAELEALNNRSCEGCKYEKEKIKLSKYNCAPYPCKECVRHVGDKKEAKQ